MDIDRLLDVLDPYTIQERGEMRSLFETVAAIDPHAEILEIGRAMGGSAALMAATGAHVISIDNTPQGPYAWERQDYLSLVSGTGGHITQIDGDAHTTDTYAEIVKWYLSRELPIQLDALLIDGGHHHEDAARDFSIYAPLVRPGGLVILHDIVSPHLEEEWYPKWLWERIHSVPDVQTKEFRDLSGGAGGWGVIVMPPYLDPQRVSLMELARGLLYAAHPPM